MLIVYSNMSRIHKKNIQSQFYQEKFLRPSSCDAFLRLREITISSVLSQLVTQQSQQCIPARHFHPVHLVWTEFHIDVVIDPTNKPADEFFIYRKIQDGCQRWPLRKVTKLAITLKLYKLENHFFCLYPCFQG